MPVLLVSFANGHTDAMMLSQLEYKGRTILFMADLLPSVAHISLPWIMAYEMFPLTTLSERRSFWSEAQCVRIAKIAYPSQIGKHDTLLPKILTRIMILH